jgi:paraquat-inducible protein B
MTPESGGGGQGPRGYFPMAIMQKGSSTALRTLRENWRLFGWIVILCAVVAIILAISAARQAGTSVFISFERGEGLKPGDSVRYCGIAIGEVADISLRPDLQGIDVHIRLQNKADHMACEGSVFWIERPLLTLAKLRGLDTLAGSKYVRVIPGPIDAKRKTVFEGLNRPPGFTETTQGASITISFEQGNGLEVGDPVRHRGLVVGEVTSIDFDRNGQGVVVDVWLLERARFLARAGTQFWVERPRMNLGEPYGLETVMGGRYITGIPGPEGAAETLSFEGLDVPAQLMRQQSGGLEVVLDSRDKRGLEPGSPVTFRGVIIGRIISVALARDAIRVSARAYIEPAYARLICENTLFWNASGIDFSLGWKGARVDMYSLKTVISGGVSIAVPADTGPQAVTGHRFVLSDRPEDAWRTWSNPVALGSTLLPPDTPAPRPLRATFVTGGRIRTRMADGWMLVLSGNRLLGPSTLFGSGQKAKPGSAYLQLGGIRMDLSAGTVTSFGELSIFSSSGALPGPDDAWPATAVRSPSVPEDCVLFSDPMLPERAIDAARMRVEDDGWEVDSALPFLPRASGSTVVARADGKVIGMLLVSPKALARVVPLSAEAATLDARLP